MTTLSLAQVPFLDDSGRVSPPWLLYLLNQNTSVVTNSGGLTLTANALIVGNGSNDIKALTSLGQAYLTLHGNSGGLPTWATVDLTTTGPTAQVSGRLALSYFPQGTLGVIGVAGSVLADPAYINAGTDNQVLRRSGTSIGFGQVNLASAAAVTGVLPAASVGPAGSDTQVQFNDAGALAGNAGFIFDKVAGTISLTSAYVGTKTVIINNTDISASGFSSMNFIAGSNTFSIVVGSQGTASGGIGKFRYDGPGGLQIYSSNVAGASVAFGTKSSVTDLVIDTSHNIGIGTAGPSGLLHLYSASTAGTSMFFQNADTGGKNWRFLSTGSANTDGAGNFGLVNVTDDPNRYRLLVKPDGTLMLEGTTSGAVGLKGAAAAGSITYTLPSADGTAGQVLKTDGAATLSWSTRLTNSAASLPAHRLIVGNTYPDVSALSSLGTKGYGLTTDGVNDPAWQDVGGLSVVIYGADPTGATDSLTAINNAITAAGSGGHVYFPPGTYKITNAIRPTSNVKLYGAGYASQISYQGTGGVTIDWINGGGSGTAYFMVLNAHGNNRAGTVDTNIEICHLRFTYTSGTSPHTILFMNTTGCSVHHCYQDGGAQDLCSFLKSKYYNVHDNYSNGAVNCAYDNWDGPSHAVISNNVAVCGAASSGIFVNGEATDTITPVQNDGFNIVVSANTLVAGATNCLQGIYVAGLTVTSTVKYVSVIGNVIKSDGGNVFSRGIDVRQGNYVAVVGNTVVGACSLNGIEITSDYNSITGNIVNGVTTATTYGIEVTGNNNMFSGNVLQGNWANFNDTGTGNQNTSNSQTLNTINIVHA